MHSRCSNGTIRKGRPVVAGINGCPDCNGSGAVESFTGVEDANGARETMTEPCGCVPTDPPESASDPWRSWARDLLAKCARAENRIRADFDPEGRMGTQPEDPGAVDDDDLRQLVESWALGNLSARQAALKAGLDLEQERARPVAEFAHEARVRALSGGLLLSAGRVRLSLTLAAARDAYRAMREILESSS